MANELYEHQKTARSKLLEHNEFALFMEQGTGKTLPMLYHVAHLLSIEEIKSCMIVAPLSTTGAWTRDIEKLPAQKQELLKNILVINYDKVWRRPELFQAKWDCIILDESHSIKHRTSKRSKCVRKIAERAKYRYILTGTPMSNGHLEEYWAQLDFLSPQIFGSYKKFEDRYCYLNQFFKPYRYQRVDELKQIIANHSYRVTKNECLDLPDKLPDEIIDVEMLEPTKYKKMLNNFIEELDIEAQNPLTRLGKLRQLCSGFIIDQTGQVIDLKTNKLKITQELLESRGDKKTVIFADFKQSIKNINKLLDQLKITHITLDGDQKDKTIWKKFQADPSIKVIVCQYQTANAGIDLYASDTIIFYEPTLSSMINEQAKDRIHRIGQHHPCSYYYLITQGSIEHKIYNTLIKGRDFGKDVLLDFLRQQQGGDDRGRIYRKTKAN